MTDTVLHLVLAPTSAEASVAVLALRLGWAPAPHLPDPALTPGDERVLGAWVQADGGNLTLHDDGVHRVLVVAGADAARRLEDLARALPCLDAEALARDFAATDPDIVARAARAAAWLGDPVLAAPLSLLRHHPDELVRDEAAAALQALVPALVASGRDTLGEELTRRGSANPLWSPTLPVHDRRQILRWLLRDQRELPRAGVAATLRAALADEDWEVRVGAILGAVLLGLAELGGLIERAELPRVSRGGPLPDDRGLLRAMHQAALRELIGRSDPPGNDTRAADRRHLRDCIAGRPTPRRDHCWLLVRSLTEPADDGGQPPLPPGARNGDGMPVLDGIPLAWLAPGEAWLGDERLEPANPLHRVDGDPAWLAARPLTCADAGTAGGDAPWRCTFEQALAWCAERTRPDLVWSVPDDATWERGARGGDGRRFPWGAGLDAGWPALPSPSGASGWGQGPEWTLRQGLLALRGGERPTPCAAWQPSDGGTALLRPLLRC